MEKFNFITCSCGYSCKDTELKEYLQEFSNGSVHIRAECPKCSKYLKYLPYSSSKTVSNIVRFVNMGKYEAIEGIVKRYVA